MLFKGSQTLPLFLVYTTQYGRGGGGGSEQDKVTTGPKGWDFLNQSIGDADKVVTGENSGTSQGEIFIFCWKEMFYWFTHLSLSLNRCFDEIAGGTDLHRNRIIG